jgi:hypothetical protein
MQAAIKKLESDLSGVLSTIRQLQQSRRPSPPAATSTLGDKSSILALVDERLSAHKQEILSALDARVKAVQDAIDATSAKTEAAQRDCRDLKGLKDEAKKAFSDIDSWRTRIDKSVEETRSLAQTALASLPGSPYRRNKRLSDSSNNSAKGSAESEDTTPQITYTPGLPTETGLHEPAVIKPTTPSSGGDDSVRGSPPSPFVAKLSTPRTTSSSSSHLDVPRPRRSEERHPTSTTSDTLLHSSSATSASQIERVRLLGKHSRGSDASDTEAAISAATVREGQRPIGRGGGGHARKRLRLSEVEQGDLPDPPETPNHHRGEYTVPLNDEPSQRQTTTIATQGSSFFASTKPIPTSPVGRRKDSLPIASLPFPLFGHPSRPSSPAAGRLSAIGGGGGSDAASSTAVPVPPTTTDIRVPAILSPSARRSRIYEQVPPPTPPASRTLYGTELAFDSRFGDPEGVGSSSVTALAQSSPTKKPWSRWIARAPSSATQEP